MRFEKKNGQFDLQSTNHKFRSGYFRLGNAEAV